MSHEQQSKMVSRRPHRKSRLGCTTCKTRRVKCDEAGPPCGPCAMRSIECKYHHSATPTYKALAADGMTNGKRTLATSDEDTRLRELKLLHQWTSVTYKSYCGTVEEEYHNWQTLIPKLALKHDCLLDGIFAMSALEIGAFSDGEPSQEYIEMALEYQNRASVKLREEIASCDLSVVERDKHQALWALSSFLMILSLAIPPYTLRSEGRYNMVIHIMTFIELLKGFVAIVWSNIDTVKSDPLLAKYKQWNELEDRSISTEVRIALERLRSLNEDWHGANRSKKRSAELQSMTCHAACRKAIFHLEECFAKCSQPDTRAYGLAWPLFGGDDYITAIRDEEPIALLILMHWGMLLEMQSYGVWYAQKVGKFLIEDLSDGLSAIEDANMQGAITWVRTQIGLE